MKITKDNAWQATLFGTAGLAITGYAYGRGWKKWVEAASIGSIAIPASAWFAYFFWGQETDPSKMTKGELKAFADNYKGKWQNFPKLLPDKAKDEIIHHCLMFENANEIVNGIGVETVWSRVKDRFDWCVYCYDRVDVLKKRSEGVIRDNWDKGFDTEGNLQFGYDFKSRTIRVLEELKLLTADFCGELVLDVKPSKKIDRVACAVAYRRLCEDTMLIEKLAVLTDREKKTLIKEINRDPQLLLAISKVNLNLLCAVEDKPGFCTAFNKSPEEFAELASF